MSNSLRMTEYMHYPRYMSCCNYSCPTSLVFYHLLSVTETSRIQNCFLCCPVAFWEHLSGLKQVVSWSLCSHYHSGELIAISPHVLQAQLLEINNTPAVTLAQPNLGASYLFHVSLLYTLFLSECTHNFHSLYYRSGLLNHFYFILRNAAQMKPDETLGIN